LAAGLLSFGAAAQVNRPATNTPPVAGPPAPPAISAEVKPAEPPDKKELSHALGIYYSQGVTNNMINTMGLDLKNDVDLAVFLEAFSNVVASVPMEMNIEELRKVLRQQDAYHKDKLDAETRKVTATGPENKAKGDKFMEDMAATTNIVKLASGVLYKVIKDGDGIKPRSVDVATLSFRATLIDNTEVWKIEKLPVKVSDPLLPAGVKEVLTMMKAGSHWMVYLPYPQAYGDKPGIPDAKRGFRVGPYSALIFDLEVESVQPMPGSPMMPPGMMPPAGMTPPPAAPPTGAVPTITSLPPPVTTSAIVRVPSAAETERGEKPRYVTDAEIEAAKAEAAKKAMTNAPGQNSPTNSGAPK
jgi:FKBP-type peptidyl-prolyl cis-trans isomerase